MLHSSHPSSWRYLPTELMWAWRTIRSYESTEIVSSCRQISCWTRHRIDESWRRRFKTIGMQVCSSSNSYELLINSTSCHATCTDSVTHIILSREMHHHAQCCSNVHRGEILKMNLTMGILLDQASQQLSIQQLWALASILRYCICQICQICQASSTMVVSYLHLIKTNKSTCTNIKSIF